MPAIHGDKATARIIVNGEVKNILTVTSWDASEDANVEKRHYAGEQYPHTRKNVMGWRGRLQTDVVNAETDKLIQQINDAEDSGVNVPQVVLAIVERYDSRDIGSGQPQGVTHIFSDVSLIYESHSGAGKPDLVQKSITFEAARKRVEDL